MRPSTGKRIRIKWKGGWFTEMEFFDINFTIKIHTRKSAKQENSLLFMTSTLQNVKMRGRKPDKNSSKRRPEFMPRNLN
jgi:hypothetical protein